MPGTRRRFGGLLWGGGAQAPGHGCGGQRVQGPYALPVLAAENPASELMLIAFPPTG